MQRITAEEVTAPKGMSGLACAPWKSPEQILEPDANPKPPTRRETMTTEMHGQEKWTNGMELRWIIGTDDSGPAMVTDSSGHVAHRGSYAECVAWLRGRACRPTHEAAL